MKKSMLALALAGVLAVGGTVLAFADNGDVSRGFAKNGTTGVENLMEKGLTFEEAKTQRLQEKFERVDAAVERGTVTAEEAATIKAEMESNSAICTEPGEGDCDGYGLNQGLCGSSQGCGFGNGSGTGNGYGNGQGGRGVGRGFGKGSCNNN